MVDTTVVYITSNRENPILEERVKQSLLEAIGDLPLISVSQKPIDFGKNICIGEREASDQNAFRQLQVGAMAATTTFISPVQSDFIYPKEYFTFNPEREDTFYCASPLWVLFALRGKGKVFCHKPRGSELIIIAGRQTVVNRLEYILDGLGEWGPASMGLRPYRRFLDRHEVKLGAFTLPTPIITFKTDNNMHRRTPHDSATKCRELPGIGTAASLIKRYLQP